MPKKLFSVVMAVMVGLTLVLSPVLAVPPLQIAQLNSPGAARTLLLPTEADNSPVISLGSGIDPVTGKKVEGIAFIHYKPGFGHKPNHNPPAGGGNGGGESKCFTYLAKGAKWNTVEPWEMNPANTRGLDQTTLFALQATALERWEDATDGVVSNGVGVEIFGTGTSTDALLAADSANPDGKNEVYFADISTENAIAVTIVWGIFFGPPSQRELVEWF